jgi:hypothetical protein
MVTTATYTVQTIQSLDELDQAWAFCAPILNLPAGDDPIPPGKHTLPYYTKVFESTPSLLIISRENDYVCGCVLASIEQDHVLVGPVAVAEEARCRGIGSAMMWKLEIEAKVLGQDTMILGGLEESELFYLKCEYKPNLYIQLPEPGCVEQLESLNPGYAIAWKAEESGKSKLMLRTPQIDKELQKKYNQAFPTCSTQYVFIKKI